ncbi:hypothetical protein EJF36_15185 [Bacillus sp. HMF5848]|uniref:ATP-binding protein n=1 Tax=Bacillus sp. HMF5848 TaxID=2495421 RepID=UPI000F7B46A3|nr:ATP-binding protein [Bacillus sp. HMF5848]RSK28114.1 hypothetical protein EJF36_15185 [Bacillus sp. HMF5848]
MRKIGNILGGLNSDMEVIEEYTCPSCNRDVRTVRVKIVGGPEKGKWETITNECDCRLAHETLEAHTRSKIKYFEQFSILNADLKNASFENFKSPYESQFHAAKLTYDYLMQFHESRHSLYLYGKPGRGKSHLAVSAYKFVKELGYTALFFDVPKLMNVIRGIVRKDVDVSENDLFTAIEQVDLLILDDIGAERMTEWVDETLYLVINQRQGKSTIYTSNVPIDQLHTRYDERLADRIKNNMSEKDIIHIDTPHSYRERNLTIHKNEDR